MLILIIIAIAIISILMSLKSLRDMQRGLKTHETRQALKKGRVIFHSSAVSSRSKK